MVAAVSHIAAGLMQRCRARVGVRARCCSQAIRQLHGSHPRRCFGFPMAPTFNRRLTAMACRWSSWFQEITAFEHWAKGRKPRNTIHCSSTPSIATSACLGACSKSLCLLAPLESDTKVVAEIFAADVKPGDWYCLHGAVGAGKSTFR